MTRLFPYPVLSVALFAMWLLLNQSLAPGHLLLAFVLAIVGPLVTTALDSPRGRIRRPMSVIRLAAAVISDIIRSNIAVTRIILSSGHGNRISGFVSIPLTLQDQNGLAILACIITATPGTIWVSMDHARGILLLHVLDLVDEEAWVHLVKTRYERRLMEIFE